LKPELSKQGLTLKPSLHIAFKTFDYPHTIILCSSKVDAALMMLKSEYSELSRALQDVNICLRNTGGQMGLIYCARISFVFAMIAVGGTTVAVDVDAAVNISAR